MSAERMRFQYTLELSLCKEPLADPPECRLLRVDDTPELAKLMRVAYQGTLDDEGEGPREALAFVQGFFSESPILSSSKIMERDPEIAAACLISLWKNTPLITTIMTHPNWKNQGLARLLLVSCLHTLRQNGYTSVTAWITEGNVASERLFSRVGFQRMDP